MILSVSALSQVVAIALTFDGTAGHEQSSWFDPTGVQLWKAAVWQIGVPAPLLRVSVRTTCKDVPRQTLIRLAVEPYEVGLTIFPTNVSVRYALVVELPPLPFVVIEVKGH